MATRHKTPLRLDPKSISTLRKAPRQRAANAVERSPTILVDFGVHATLVGILAQ